MSKQCYAIGGRINFNYDTISLCHGIDIGDRIIWRYDSGDVFTPEYYIDAIKEINEKNQTETPICRGCSNLTENEERPQKIDIVTINPMYYCQNRCIYCGNFRGERKSLYDPLPIIEKFIEAGMIADTCLFDWGGGEPTVSDDFEKIFMYLLRHKYMQRVNTNAITMSKLVLDHLSNDLVSLRISLDAGNEKAFLATKGRKMFLQVVKNIADYRKRTENLLLKYVITNSNSDEKSVRDFIDLAIKLDIKAICIDTDMLSFGWEDYPDLLQFTEKELHAAHLMQELAHEKGLNVQIGYVWTARDLKTPSRDFNHIDYIEELIENNETYHLPEKLSDFHNRRNSRFVNHITPIVLASFETLFHFMRNKKIILYGAGNNGRKLLKVLREFKLKVDCFCDKAKAGDVIDGVEVKDVETIVKAIDNETAVIITPYKVKDILYEFNEKNYAALIGHLYYIDEFRYSGQVLETMR